MAQSPTQSKDKQAIKPLLAPPAAGSANPAVSLESLWSYVQPALDHLLQFNKDGSSVPPALEPAYHMGIHTVIYNHFTSQPEANTTHSRYKQLNQPRNGFSTNRWEEASVNAPPDLYLLLDRHLQSYVQDIFQSTPSGGEPLVRYYVAQFERFAAGMQSIHRLLNYVNRHYVKRAQDEDKGWLRMADILDGEFARSLGKKEDLTRNRLLEALKERRLKELELWGYERGDGEESMAFAEACAEAATSPDRIVHVNAMGFRRWRVEMVEPLLAVPKVGARPANLKGGGGSKANKGGVKRPPALKSRLSRAVDDIFESYLLSGPEKKELANRLDSSLQMAGIRREHQLRKRLQRTVVVVQKQGNRPG